MNMTAIAELIYLEKDPVDIVLYRSTFWKLYKLFPDVFQFEKQIPLLNQYYSIQLCLLYEVSKKKY